jgi:4-amino-4-deoxy-L-arabinose transferase-like glycosyltransferase
MATLASFLLIFYCLWLNSYPLFTPDEGRYVSAAKDMILTGDYITPRINGIPFLEKPILYYWFQALALTLFGTNEWAARLFPVLFGLIGALTTYFCGRYLFDRKTGFVSALILISSPLYFTSAHYANLDLEIAVFLSCTLLFFITGTQSKDKSRNVFFFLSYISAGLAFLTKGLIGLAFPVMIIGAWIVLQSRWDILKKIKLVPGLLLILGIILPWCILVQKDNPDFFHYFFVIQQVSRFLSVGVFNNVAPIWFYLPVIFIGFLPWSLFLIQALWQHCSHFIHHRKENETTLFLLLWIGIIFIFFSIPHSKIITYQLPIFPPLSLLVGNYLASIWNKNARSIRISNIFFIFGGTLFALITFIYLQFNAFNFSSDFLPYLSTIIILIILASLTNLLVLIFKKDTLPVLLSIYLSFAVLSLLTLVQGAKYLNQDSTKSLVDNLKMRLKPDDEVVNYYNYFYDMPFYLGRPITVVANWYAPNISRKDNWVRELSFGSNFQEQNSLLISEDLFWKKWNSSKHVFVFVNTKYLDQFKSHAKQYYLLSTSYDINLLSNQPDLI